MSTENMAQTAENMQGRGFTSSAVQHRGFGSRAADACIYVFLIFCALTIVIPFYNMLLISVADYSDALSGGIYLWLKSFTMENYVRIFSDNKLIDSIWVSVRNVVTGTAMSLVITVFAAYTLYKKKFPFRRVMFYFCIFTMYFGGGLIPWYLVLKSLGFVDNIWVMTIPNMLSTFNMILLRNFFLSIPESLEESATLDGAGEFVIMWWIIVPLSAPIMATIALFYAVAFWNEWWNAMLFIQRQKLVPLALLLRRIVIDNNMELGAKMANAKRSHLVKVHSRSIQMATVTVATIPILCVYPFLQKYFTKGIMLGSIKA
jgi:putative aldouronate transport system permease protein